MEILETPGEEPGHQEPWMVLEKGRPGKKAVSHGEGVPFVCCWAEGGRE